MQPNNTETTAIALTPAVIDASRKRRGRPTREEPEAKRERAEQTDFLIGCTPDERAYCVRLIRLLRDKNYWMAEFVRQILDKEARTKWQHTIKDLQALLNNFDTIETLADNANRLGKDWSNHPVLRAVREAWAEDEIAEYIGERRVRELINSARKK